LGNSFFSANDIKAALFYEKNYELVNSFFIEPNKKITLGSNEYPRICRFCRKGQPEVSFKDDAHALPAAFGNTGLFSYYECDTCNHLFGEGIENHLGNWSKPMRTLSRIKGRSGVPTVKKPGSKNGWRIEYLDSKFQMKEYEDEPFFYVNEKERKIQFELFRDTYIPTAVLKGLVKIGITILPEFEVQYFNEACDWIRDTNHSRPFVSGFPMFSTFIPGPMRNDLIVLMLMRRRTTVANVPYAFLIFSYGNEVMQVFLPSICQDKCIHGKKFTMPIFPSPKHTNSKKYGKPITKINNLTSYDPIKSEKVLVGFGFDTSIII